MALYFSLKQLFLEGVFGLMVMAICLVGFVSEFLLELPFRVMVFFDRRRFRDLP